MNYNEFFKIAKGHEPYPFSTMTYDWATRIYAILEAHCDASPGYAHRAAFKFFMLEVTPSSADTEYRFLSSLGFGGKFRTSLERWYVDQYPENETPATITSVRRANAELRALRREWLRISL